MEVNKIFQFVLVIVSIAYCCILHQYNQYQKNNKLHNAYTALIPESKIIKSQMQ